MRGSVLGPLRGCVFFGFFFFLVETPPAFCRFSAAAKTASLCLARSDSVTEGSMRFSGRFTLSLDDPERAAAADNCGGGSLADPSRFPCGVVAQIKVREINTTAMSTKRNGFVSAKQEIPISH